MAQASTALIMLPGLDGTGVVFEPLLQHLPETIAPVVVRYPCDKVMSFQDHVRFARAHLPDETPFVLLAESFSGPVALQLLAAPPGNLLGVIFVATFGRYPKPFLLDLARLLPQKLLHRLFCTNLGTRFFCLGSAPADAVTLFRQALASVALKVLSKRLQILAELPPPEVAYQGPALYLLATHDHLVPPRAAAQLLRDLPQLHVVRCAGPHILLLADPKAGARQISAFITKLAGEKCQD